MRIQANKKRFHGKWNTEIAFKEAQASTTGFRPGRWVTRQEYEVSYRFYSHFHPYIQQLTQKLIRRGVGGLQSADTEYTADNRTLPFSTKIHLPANTKGIKLPKGSKIVLLEPLMVRIIADHQDILLGSNMELKLEKDISLTIALPEGNPEEVKNGLQAILVEGIPLTEQEGDNIQTKKVEDAVTFTNATIILPGHTTMSLPDGRIVESLSSVMPSHVLLLAGAEIRIPKNTTASLLEKKSLPELFEEFFSANYQPSGLVEQPYPVKNLDFTTSGAYSIYNWELFFHAPLTIAIHLGKNHRFAEAQQWFHYIFDPTDDSDGPTPERFWKVYPFQHTDVRKIEEILVNLSTGADPDLQQETENSIRDWREKPFRPHVIARHRQQAYMFKTVMAYLDNLIAWGDSLFRQDTGEAIDEALMIYVLAANLLGPRPQVVPKKGSVAPQNYANLRKDLDKFGNTMRDMELDLPFDQMLSSTDVDDEKGLTTIRSLGQTLYFCTPHNDKLLGYWDTVADRLFKIRNSLNIQGTFRQLALFEPPIDPAMLARATAAGLDIGAIVNGVNQPLPLVRFQLLVQKATEIAQEVKSLGNSLLAAMEKEDNEAMVILRAKHERVVMEMVEVTKYAQLQEAIKSKEGLFKSLALAIQRYTFYERQLGKKPDEIEKSIPDLDGLDRDSLEKMKFSSDETEIISRDIEILSSHKFHASAKP